VIRLVGAAETSPGQVRSENQDRPVLTEWVAGVADGMGGHRGGETAAQLAVTELALLRGPGELDELVAAIKAANERILAQDEDPGLRGMGTTLVAMVVDGDDVVLANVGDSRAYRLLDGRLEQLTRDHSLVEDLVRQGQLSAEEARNHPQRNIVTRALGIAPRLQIDVFRTAAQPGDRYLLCSDGLFNEVDAEHIATELERESDPATAARTLVRLANDAGARDNVTCVVVDLVEDRQPEAAGASVPSSSVAAGAGPGPSGLAPSAGPGVDRSVRPHVEGSELDGDAFPAADTVASIPSEGRSGRRAARGPDRRRTRIPWRALPYVLAVLVIAGAAVGGTIWWGTSSYYVDEIQGEVVIMQGRPGGVLWMEPTVREVTGIDYDDLTGASQQRLADPPVGSLEQARQLVAGLRTRDATTSDTTSDGTTSNGTAPPTARGSGTTDGPAPGPATG
jgi:PPM family protein phosphatase